VSPVLADRDLAHDTFSGAELGGDLAMRAHFPQSLSDRSCGRPIDSAAGMRVAHQHGAVGVFVVVVLPSRDVAEVCETVVGAHAVEMCDFHPLRARPAEGLPDEAVHAGPALPAPDAQHCAQVAVGSRRSEPAEGAVRGSRAGPGAPQAPIPIDEVPGKSRHWPEAGRSRLDHVGEPSAGGQEERAAEAALRRVRFDPGRPTGRCRNS